MEPFFLKKEWLRFLFLQWVCPVIVKNGYSAICLVTWGASESARCSTPQERRENSANGACYFCLDLIG
nr:MAG TPA: hypothetical protein [Caudoviricetes sp.]